MSPKKKADKIYQRELKKVSPQVSHIGTISFLMYFGVLKEVELGVLSGKPKIQESKPIIPLPQPSLTTGLPQGKSSRDELWSNPLFTLYPKMALTQKEIRNNKIKFIPRSGFF